MSDTTDTATAVPSDIISDAHVNGLKDPETTEDSEPEIDELCIGRDGIARSAPTTIEPADMTRADAVVPSAKAPRAPKIMTLVRPAPNGAKPKQAGMKMKPSPPTPDDGEQLKAEIKAKCGDRELLPHINIGAPIHEVIDRIDKAVAQATLSGKAEIYRQDGRLVAIVRTPSKSGRPKPKIMDISKDAFPVYLSTLIVFFKMESEAAVILTSCPAGLARAFLEYKGASSIPILTKILGAPTLREDFTLVDARGYDPASGFYLEFDGEFFPVPKNPDKDCAQSALQRLKKPIRFFPFIDRAAESAVLAMFITAVVRGCLPSAPLFAVSAPTMGTGKSKLTDMAAILATGDYAQALSYKFEEKEMEKTLFAALREGTAVVCIDNIETHLRGAALCTMLTQRSYKSRILGVSETLTVPTIGLFLANGNNLIIRGDLSTRVILSTLDAGLERPQERKFDFDPCEFMLRHRKKLIQDILTVVLAYRASTEKVSVRPFGRFEAWSELVREPLVWLSESDPLDTVELVEKTDPVRQTLSEVLNALRGRFGDERFMAKDCAAIDPTWYYKSQKREAQSTLIDALNAAIASPRGLNGRTVGNWLAQYENRIESGMKIIQDGERQKIACWRVVIVDSEDTGGFGSHPYIYAGAHAYI